MSLPAIYTSENCRPVHNLRYDWTGWFKAPPPSNPQVRSAIARCLPKWHEDGFDDLRSSTDAATVQILATVQPHVSPTFFTQRIKARLQYALRDANAANAFRRKTAFRTVGDNTRTTVSKYVGNQALNSDYADPRFKDYLGHFVVEGSGVHLEAASETARGRYWYNLHLVIVVEDRRHPVTRNENFLKLRRTCDAIAEKKGYRISNLAIMPDHVHVALRGELTQSPEDIALAFLNNLSYVMGYNRCWSWEYYVGTFSEYTVRAIRGTR